MVAVLESCDLVRAVRPARDSSRVSPSRALRVWGCSLALALLACGAKAPPDVCPPSRSEGGRYFSQFYEDYILAHVFADLEAGVYVDVGASHPLHNSVTHYFHARGWSGMNIDANPRFRKLYERHRPRDVNRFVGVAEEPGVLTLYKVSDAPGVNRFAIAPLSTFDAAIAENHRQKGFLVKEIAVPVERLDALIAEHAMDEVTFLNVDVEGFERSVLASMDFDAVRPRVVVVEATYPNTLVPVHERWERILTDKGYVFALTDSLNRYYVDRDHADLLPRFEYIGDCVAAAASRGRRGR